MSNSSFFILRFRSGSLLYKRCKLGRRGLQGHVKKIGAPLLPGKPCPLRGSFGPLSGSRKCSIGPPLEPLWGLFEAPLGPLKSPLVAPLRRSRCPVGLSGAPLVARALIKFVGSIDLYRALRVSKEIKQKEKLRKESFFPRIVSLGDFVSVGRWWFNRHFLGIKSTGKM